MFDICLYTDPGSLPPTHHSAKPQPGRDMDMEGAVTPWPAGFLGPWGCLLSEAFPILRAELLENMWGYLCQRPNGADISDSIWSQVLCCPSPTIICFPEHPSASPSWFQGQHSLKLSRWNYRRAKDSSTALSGRKKFIQNLSFFPQI